jgi:hypothetical protein
MMGCNGFANLSATIARFPGSFPAVKTEILPPKGAK